MQLGTTVTLLLVMLASMHCLALADSQVTGISFNVTFGSYMVLQQAPAKACVYGVLGPGGTAASVSVKSDLEAPYTLRAQLLGPDVRTADTLLGWKACLKPAQAGGDVTITAVCTGCTNTTPAVLEHVTFGDVWYCGGQSNMALPLLHSLTRNVSRDAILSGKYANIRIHGMEGNMNSFQPWATLKQALSSPPDLSGAHGNACDPSQDSDCSALMRFPATCYYFGESLTDAHQSRGAVAPLGLINTAWGGSSIEQWLTNTSISTCGFVQTSSSSQEWHDTRVVPYLGMTRKGWVWYQGENDMHGVMGNSAAHAGYSCLMKTLIVQWRQLWSITPGTTDPDAPFGVVTLASSGGEGANGLAMGAMRQAQTAGFGVLPAPGLPKTFLAQAYDLDDEWVSFSGGGPCMSYGYNASDPAHHCCGSGANASLCPATWRERCTNMCASLAGTTQYMGGLHPRSKRPVGQRLARAAFNTVFGGNAAFTGPTLAGCQLNATSDTLLIRFNETLLRGDSVQVRPYARPNFTPYFHGHANPGFHSGSQLWVQTVASSFCVEYMHLNVSNASSPVYCPTWAGGVGTSSTRPAPAGRFPSFDGNGDAPISDPNQFNMGWINLPLRAGPTPTSAIVDLAPLRGSVPTAVRYAWGIVDCCDLSDPSLYSEHGCIANCPLVGSSGLPANPFMARIEGGKCTCVAPQRCEE